MSYGQLKEQNCSGKYYYCPRNQEKYHKSYYDLPDAYKCETKATVEGKDYMVGYLCPSDIACNIVTLENMSQAFEEAYGDSSGAYISEGKSVEPFCTIHEKEVFCNAFCKVKCEKTTKYSVVQKIVDN